MKNVSTFGRNEYVGKQGTADSAATQVRVAQCLPAIASPQNLPALAGTTLEYSQVVQLARACTHACFAKHGCKHDSGCFPATQQLTKSD